jgi:phospholipid/cholesterol/gamma-HCH transport system permease protein
MTALFKFIGRRAYGFFGHLYRMWTYALASALEVRNVYFYRRQIIEQFYWIGIETLPLVCLISVFTGMAISIQTAYQMSDYVPRYMVGSIVVKSTVLELAPTMMALVIAGRVGAGIASEIGTMKVSEQVDALQSMAVDPVGYLMMPRVLGGLIMVPVLVVFSEVVSIGGGFAIAVLKMGLAPAEFIKGMQLNFYAYDVFVGLIKAMCYGWLITFIGSYMGLETKGGAAGVGAAATTSVVISSALILISDWFITDLLLHI